MYTCATCRFEPTDQECMTCVWPSNWEPKETEEENIGIYWPNIYDHFKTIELERGDAS